jgi:thioredoxin-like negative regulator of GroEL
MLELSDSAEAEASVREALAILAGSSPERPAELSEAQGILAECLSAQGRHDEAQEVLLQRHQDISASGAELPEGLLTVNRFADLHHAWTRPTQPDEFHAQLPTAQ